MSNGKKDFWIIFITSLVVTIAILLFFLKVMVFFKILNY